MLPSVAVLNSFRARGDNQIMSLELLSIAFGLSVFEDIVRGNLLHVHSDNTGAEHVTERGIARSEHCDLFALAFQYVLCLFRSFDHTCLVHGIWLRAAELGTGLYVGRVPTKDNISDDPSRERYTLLNGIGAIRLEPWLHPTFEAAQTWKALSLVQRQPRLSDAPV